MKVSLNSIRGLNKRYQCANDFKLSDDELIEKIGAQLGAIDDIKRFSDTYRGCVVVKVVSCDKHPDADKLHVCRIDDGQVVKDVERGDDGLVQVVCGAPNVHAGMLAVWLPPGTTVPATRDHEPFVLEARELRGQRSNGMLASLKELGLGDDHTGILEVTAAPAAAVPGASFGSAFELDNDVILDIENKMFTHRPDCFGFLGIARELAGIQQVPFKSPDWYVSPANVPAETDSALALTVTNELPQLVPRFTAIVISDVQVGPSPTWLQVELAKVGQKSINNIVDYTNFFMLETGQPLHAYDYDKVKALSNGEAALVVRNPKPGEKVQLLNGKEIEPRPEAIMIATDKQLIGVGGVMGGNATEVDSDTTNIIVECANFDMYSVRRTSMAHGLFTDAVTRFTKGQSPLQLTAVLAKISDEICQFAGGKIASRLIDDNHIESKVLERQSLHPGVSLEVDFINERLGVELSAEAIGRLLSNVEFRVEIEGSKLVVTAPFWRTDIELREDVVEEVGRLYGFDRLPLMLPLRDVTPAAQNPLLGLKADVRSALSRAGANEVLTYSFVHGDLLTKVGQQTEQAYQIANALSPDLQYYRLSLLPSLLEKVHPNVKAGYDEFALFELGKAHVVGQEEDGLPREFERLALVYAAAKRRGAAYYQALEYVMNLLGGLGLAQRLTAVPMSGDETDVAAVYYAPGRAATLSIDGTVIGRIGELKPTVRQALKLPPFTAGFELSLQPLLDKRHPRSYTALSRFPAVTQDMTLRVPAELPYQDLDALLREQIEQQRPAHSQATLLPLDIFQKSDDQAHKQVSFRLKIASYERTLTDVEVNKLLDGVAAAAHDAVGAERI